MRVAGGPGCLMFQALERKADARESLIAHARPPVQARTRTGCGVVGTIANLEQFPWHHWRGYTFAPLWE